MLGKLYKLMLYSMIVSLMVMFCAPAVTESRRVIFYAPRQVQLFTGQILSSRAMEKPCPPCQMRDHRGRCRKIIHFNTNGGKC